MIKEILNNNDNKELIMNTEPILQKYKDFVSKNDLGKIMSLTLENPDKDLESITEKYIEKKYSIDKIDKFISSTRGKSYTHNTLMKNLGISRSRFYFWLNYIKRFYIKKKVDQALEKNMTTNLSYEKQDKRHIQLLLNHKKLKRNILLNPGPVLTTAGVKNALIQNDICHRDLDFELLMKRLKKNALKVFEADKNYSALFISGSGTSGLESAISSTVPKNKKILVLSNGAFGERLYKIASLHKLKIVLIKKSWGELLDITEIENKLKTHKDIFAIVMNHHETSVGILNPVKKIGALAKKYNKLLLVDAISSLGAEKISVKQDNIDICISSANKCLHGFSGIALICVNNRVWDIIKDIQPRSFYLDLKAYHKYSTELNQTPYTPAVANLFALDQAIRELLKEGLKNRQLRYIELNSILRYELSNLGFEFFTNYGCESHSVLTVKIPEDITFKDLYTGIKEEDFTIYPCKSALKDKYFQIANMGALRRGMVYDFIFTVEKSLRKLREKTYLKKDNKFISNLKIDAGFLFSK